MSTDSADAYEENAERFLQQRDQSTVGIDVVDRWAQSLGTGTQVLELGCGGGIPVTRTLFYAGLNVRAIDASPSLVATFRERFPNVPIKCERVQDSDFFDMTFDAVIAIGLIFLLDADDQVALLLRVADALEPGGRFLFTAPVETGESRDEGTDHPCRSLGQAAYEDALRHAGFRILGYHEDRGRNHYYEAERLDP